MKKLIQLYSQTAFIRRMKIPFFSAWKYTLSMARRKGQSFVLLFTSSNTILHSHPNCRVAQGQEHGQIHVLRILNRSWVVSRRFHNVIIFHSGSACFTMDDLSKRVHLKKLCFWVMLCFTGVSRSFLGSSSSSSTSQSITKEGSRLQAVVVVACVHSTPGFQLYWIHSRYWICWWLLLFNAI